MQSRSVAGPYSAVGQAARPRLVRSASVWDCVLDGENGTEGEVKMEAAEGGRTEMLLRRESHEDVRACL
jgi:hypothetical protein